MSEILIKKEYIIPDLTPGEVMLLTFLNTSNKLLFKHFCKIYEHHIPMMVESLQNKGYLKNINSFNEVVFEDLVLRQKSEDLFKDVSIEKDVDEVLNYLNKILNKKRGFSLKSKGNRRFVGARLRDDYSVEDLKGVIDVKYNEWSNTSQEVYLRPETLFNETKFSSYIMQADGRKSNTKSSRFSLPGED